MLDYEWPPPLATCSHVSKQVGSGLYVCCADLPSCAFPCILEK